MMEWHKQLAPNLSWSRRSSSIERGAQYRLSATNKSGQNWELTYWKTEATHKRDGEGCRCFASTFRHMGDGVITSWWKRVIMCAYAFAKTCDPETREELESIASEAEASLALFGYPMIKGKPCGFLSTTAREKAGGYLQGDER
jgi:hypothetical protein